MFPDGEEALISGEEVSVPHIATSPTMAALSSCFYRTPAARGIPAEVYEAASLPDWLFNIHIAQAGRVGFMRETTSAIRYHEQGIWSGLPTDAKRARIAETRDACRKRFGTARGFDDSFIMFSVTSATDANCSELFWAQLDQPASSGKSYVERGQIRASGWIVGKRRQYVRLRVRHSWGTQAFSIEPNQIREDVADQISRESGMYCTIFCGFDFDLPFSGTADTFEFSLETQEGIHPWCVLVGSLEGGECRVSRAGTT
jgi:hypothetical protein